MQRYSAAYGIAAPELGWVPAPTYILRRAAIFDLLQDRPPGRVLEIGCGAGALLYDLAQRGFHGLGVETSDTARNVATHLLQRFPGFEVLERLPEPAQADADYLLSFEVLEHIEDDVGALCNWSRHLRPGGTFLLSVPAHRRRWNASDVWAGHYRRYESDELLEKLERSGFRVLTLYSYGWPLSNCLHPVRAWIHGRRLRGQATHPTSQLANTHRSGIDRSVEATLYPFYSSAVPRLLMRLFQALQRRTYRSHRGTGYLAAAVRA
jgi:SAM-dependent methyltransferase